ncbi:MAG: response regulator [Desulfatirhabdiaceae bacterium]
MTDVTPKYRILIVDDEAFVGELLSEYLSGNGYAVMTAENGEDAIAAYSRFKPDAVILDIRMPGMSGIDVLKRMKELDNKPAIIMSSAYGDSETINETMAQGADYYLQKPMTLSTLLEMLERILESAKRT